MLQILNEVDRDPTPAERLRDAGRRSRVAVSRPASPSSALRRLGASGWLLLALLLAVLAALAGSSSHLAGVALGFASLASLAMIWRSSATTGPGGPRRWRGQDLDGPPTNRPG